MLSSLGANARFLPLLALTCVLGACDAPGAKSMGKRDVEVTFTTRDQEQRGGPGAVEAATGDPLAADIYLFDEYQWADFEQKNLFGEIRRLNAAGEDDAVAQCLAELLEALAPRRVEGAKTRDTKLVPNVPHVFVAVRGDQVAFREFDALRERTVEISFD